MRRISNLSGGLWGVPLEAFGRSADECGGCQIRAEASGDCLQRLSGGVRTSAEDVKFERRRLGTRAGGLRREECGRVRTILNWKLEDGRVGRRAREREG